MADQARARRLAVRIREIVAATLETRVKDPRLGMVTITDARVTAGPAGRDVFYTVYGDEAARADTAAALESAKRRAAQRGRPADRRQVHPDAGVRPGRACPSSAGRIDELLAVARDADAGLAQVRRGRDVRRGPDPYQHEHDDLDETDDADRSDRGGLGLAGRAVCRLADRAAAAHRGGVGQGGRGARGRPGRGGARLPRQPGRRRRRQHARAGARAAPARHPACCRRSARRSSWPSSLTGLPGVDLLVPPEQVPAAPALLVTLDTGSADRLGSLAPLVDCRGRGARRRPPRLQHPLRHAAPGRPGRRGDRGAGRGAGPPARRRARRRTSPPASTPGWSPTPARSGTPRPRRRRTSWRPGCCATGHPARPDHPPAAGHPPVGWLRHGRRARSAGPGWSRTRSAGSAWSGPRPGWPTWPPPGSAPDQAESVIDLVRTAAEAEVAMVCKAGRGRRLDGVDAVQGPGRRERRGGRARRRRAPVRGRLQLRRRPGRDRRPRRAPPLADRAPACPDDRPRRRAGWSSSTSRPG